MKEVWISNIFEEINFWKLIITGQFPNKAWCDDFKKRLKGENIAPGHLGKWLDNSPKILDVGSGPASILGAFYKGKPLNLTPVDPLANIYNILMDEAGVQPKIKPVFAFGEDLPKYIDEKYDFVYSRNALDHSYAPFRVIQHMVDLCGGGVLIENHINEGLANSYNGLHKWNFMPASNDLVIWDQSGKGRLLSKELRPDSYASITTGVLDRSLMFVEIMK